MEEFSTIQTKQFRGQGFMTVCKYNNEGDIIYIGDKDSKTIVAIDTYDYNVIGTFSYHNGIVWSLDVSGDDNVLISASGDLTIGFFNAKDGTKLFQSNERCIPKFVCAQKPNHSCALIPATPATPATHTTNLKSNLVGIICEALTKKSFSYISIYDLDLINQLNDFSQPIKLIWTRQSKPITMVWNGVDELIVGCDDGKIIQRKITDLEGKEEKEYQIHSESIKSIVWNRTNNHILTSSLDSTAKHLDPSNEFKLVAEYKSSVPINYACWNHNDRKVLLGGGIEAMNVAKTSDNDLNLKIYRTKDQKLTNHIGSHFGPIRFIDKAPNSKNFITASQDGSVKIYLVMDEDPQDNNLDKKINETKPNFIRFGLGLEKNDRLTDGTEKIINLTWKPTKSDKLDKLNKSVEQKGQKGQREQKWIPGMPMPKNTNNDVFRPSYLSSDYLSSDMNERYEQFKKQEIEQNSTIRITNLPHDICVRDLYELFDLYGRIEERGGIKIKDYGDSTMAFIKYVYPESAIKALNNMNGYPINHMIINVEMAKPK